MKVAIRHISLRSLGKFGCLLGVVIALLPSLLCGLLGVGLAGLLHSWLESWQSMTITVLGQELATFDLVYILGLDQVLDFLQVLTTASLPVLILAVLAMALVAGILLALIIALAGVVYNLLAAATGGLVVEMNSVNKRGDAR